MNYKSILTITAITLSLIACSPKDTNVTPSVTPTPVVEYVVHEHGYDRALAHLQYNPVILAAAGSSIQRVGQMYSNMSNGGKPQDTEDGYGNLDDAVRTELQAVIGDGIQVAFLVTKQGLVWTGYDHDPSLPDSWVPASDLMFDQSTTEDTQFWAFQGRLLMVRNVFNEDGSVAGMVGITVGPTLTVIEH